eukprot:COSAG01_NODE_1023_length_12063_cov_25.977432_11_plen_134_part_00
MVGPACLSADVELSVVTGQPTQPVITWGWPRTAWSGCLTPDGGACVSTDMQGDSGEKWNRCDARSAHGGASGERGWSAEAWPYRTIDWSAPCAVGRRLVAGAFSGKRPVPSDTRRPTGHTTVHNSGCEGARAC